ncbi:MAG: adenine phosphoribosyltransferase [Galactobacillus timonensis]|uniref:adenine phosphoribosyltransferase n=1 Tax=Galactobacillus timonensis TaxID=2041840 RepID=UPI000C82F6AF|nr:adenine phosphoribosyltransferase [Galactobacillus timonensis]MDY6281607.1 adenine phosphoribosyltransferase [Erysipelotrichaceae bacterium]MDD5851336.1 adenine phosphoribosyltransferase [Galactobacillus timonensis]MDD6369803.1 adenine phosphoribosyltransferase [Galactobacillus timonensis]MDD6600162.1 adenine phosphoribosyltransferase [Galactobacillus timonensis]MDD6680636.1 adenine phosphoribosyltransferase [Galactobacillus timonensis]
MDLKDYIASIPDYPTKGILFRDVTPLVDDGEAFKEAVRQLAEYAKSVGADLIAGPESRGFIFGCPTAYELGIGFVPVRKPGKLPRETISASYSLEYGTNELFMHKDAVKPGQRVVIIDDLLATGGTAKATAEMVKKLGGVVAGCAFVIELDGLPGRVTLEQEGYDVKALMHLSDH